MNTHDLRRNAGKTAVAALAVIASVAIPVGIANAQSAESYDPTNRPFRLKLGAYFPTDGDLRRATEDAYFGAGISYDVLRGKGKTPIVGEVYNDFALYDRRGTQALINGTGVGARAYFGQPQSSVQPYAGLGIGGYYIRTEANGNDNDDFKVGGKFTLGLESKQGWLVEANYTLIDKVRGIDYSGPAAYVGYRF